MNIDFNIANRAFMKAGEEPLTDTDIQTGSTRYRTLKELYLTTILETLSNTEWTSQKTRKKLELAPEEAKNYTNYGLMYKLPLDCAKPVALQDDGEFIVEGRWLYTDSGDAVLLYVTNGFTGEHEYVKAEPQPSGETFSESEYYYIDEDNIIHRAEEYEMGIVYLVEKPEDYPGYKELVEDPLLFEYIATRLAAKFVLKFTGNLQLYSALYSESYAMENRAIKSTVAHSKSRDEGHKYWGEILGLSGDGL